MVRAGVIASALYIKWDLTLIIIISLMRQIQAKVWFFCLAGWVFYISNCFLIDLWLI